MNSSFFLRAGETGEVVRGTPGHVPTAQADGTFKPEAPAVSNPSALRATWAFTDTLTFTDSATLVSEPGVFSGVQTGDTVFIPAQNILSGSFHSGSPAPELGGLYIVLDAIDTETLNVSRDPRMASSEQIADIAIVSADQGSGAAIYQIATPPAAIINVDPQVTPMVALPPLASSSVFVLTSQSGVMSWQLGSINAP